MVRRKDGRYEVRVSTPDGRRSFYRKTEREAEDLLAQLRAGSVAPSRLTLAAWCEQWLEDVVRPGNPTTYERYTMRVRRYIVPELGRVRLADLTPRHIAAFQRALLATPRRPGSRQTLAPNSVRAYMATLSGLLAEAERWGLLARNPARLVRAVPAPDPSATSLDVEEARAVLSAVAAHPLGTFYVVTLLLGLRSGEARGLRWQDVDLTERQLTVAGQVVVRPPALRRPGEGTLQWARTKRRTSRRTIALPERAVEALELQADLQEVMRRRAGAMWHEPIPGLVWTTRTGAPFHPGHVQGFLDRIMADAGLPRVVMHQLRHSATSILLAEGAPLPAVMELLGHSKAETTLGVYAHVLSESRRDLARRMDAAMMNGVNGVPAE